MPALFSIAIVLYLGIDAFEGPLRYMLLLTHTDNVIYARDLLIFGPLAALIIIQGLRQRLDIPVLVFAILCTFHGLVMVGNTGSAMAAALGAKNLVNLLFGFLAAALLVAPGRAMWRALALIWLITIVGVVIDKLQLIDFPWIGMKTMVDGVSVDVSHDWSIDDPLSRRVAGFTRNSITVALLVPALAIVLIGQLRSQLLRWSIALASVLAVLITTQKGAVVAFAPVAALACLPGPGRATALRILGVAFLVLGASLPLLTYGLETPHSDYGVFTAASIYSRITETWPDALRWIAGHQIFIFGVGLGGIAGPQRFFAPDQFTPVDNLYLLMYGWFGIFAVPYLLTVLALIFRRVSGVAERVVPALALVAFYFGYGAVLSILEDQTATLFLGAAIGVLWRETSRVAVDAPAAPGHFLPLPAPRAWPASTLPGTALE